MCRKRVKYGQSVDETITTEHQQLRGRKIGLLVTSDSSLAA
jgi:hypothetical protein